MAFQLFKKRKDEEKRREEELDEIKGALSEDHIQPSSEIETRWGEPVVEQPEQPIEPEITEKVEPSKDITDDFKHLEEKTKISTLMIDKRLSQMENRIERLVKSREQAAPATPQAEQAVSSGLYDKIDEVSESMSKLEEDLYKRLATIDTNITELQNAPKPQPTTVQPCECDYPSILKRINDLKSELSSVQSYKCDYPGMLKSINDLRSELSSIRGRMGGIVKGEVAVHEGTAGHVAMAERSIKLLTDELTTLRNNFRNLSETTDRRMADRIGRAFGELAVRMDSIEKKISKFEKQLSNEQLTHPIIIE